MLRTKHQRAPVADSLAEVGYYTSGGGAVLRNGVLGAATKQDVAVRKRNVVGDHPEPALGGERHRSRVREVLGAKAAALGRLAARIMVSEGVPLTTAHHLAVDDMSRVRAAERAVVPTQPGPAVRSIGGVAVLGRSNRQ